MKTTYHRFRPFLASAIFGIAIQTSYAATAFWSFQTNADGSIGASTMNFTINDGFSGVPSISSFTGSQSTVANTGGQQSFDFESETYTGNGTDVGGGASRALGWQATSSNILTGSGFSLQLNTTNLTALSLDFSHRSASQSGATGPAPTRFDFIDYSLDGGLNWLDTGKASSFTFVADRSFNQRAALDLSDLTMLDNQADVQLRFILGDTKIAAGTINFRIDNLVVNAIPEPMSLSLLGLSLGAFGLRRRR